MTSPSSSAATQASLPPGFTIRPAGWSDADATSRLTAAYWNSMSDPVLAISPDEMRQFWNSPGLRLETDTWVIETPDGRIVGYAEFYNRHGHAALVGEGYVHPDFRARGIGTVLLRQLLHRAGQESALATPGARVYLRNGVSASDAAGRALHEVEGFVPIRHSWRMEIQLAQARNPVWPEGMSLRPFDRAVHDRVLFEAHERAFADHFGHTPFTCESWQHHVSGRQDFDPNVWHVAWCGDEIAGYSICNYGEGAGWVDKLGVLPKWRRRGLGLALLEHSFNAFLQHGVRVVTLGVDAESPTGATRLYERAGMRVASKIIRYEKELRPGQPS